MGMMRTGAASGEPTKVLALDKASVVGQIGAGSQAAGQLEAVCAAKPIARAQVFARNREKLRAFCDAMSRKLGIPVDPVCSVQAAVHGAHVVNVITSASEPVLRGEWLEPGQHINAAGSNCLSRRELDEAAIRRCEVIAVDSRHTARNECGDLQSSVERGALRWETLAEIGEVLRAPGTGRTSSQQITLYESQGLGVQDLYVGAWVFAHARERNVGIDLPIS
jgi:ornithine cyclodeaminase